jgi:hypothetical protein
MLNNGNFGHIGPRGTLSMKRVAAVPVTVPGFLGMCRVFSHGLPHPRLSWEVFAWRVRNLPCLLLGAWRVLFACLIGLPNIAGVLYLRVIRADGTILNYGTASFRVITTTGAGFIVDAFQNIVEAENMKFHAIGTGTNAEAVGDTALQTELTTQYNPDNTRATGSQTENGSTVYRTVGTNTVDATAAVTEHGILSQAATGGGVLLDRSQFSVINLASGDSIQSTYDLTVNTGG